MPKKIEELQIRLDNLTQELARYSRLDYAIPAQYERALDRIPVLREIQPALWADARDRIDRISLVLGAIRAQERRLQDLIPTDWVTATDYYGALKVFDCAEWEGLHVLGRLEVLLQAFRAVSADLHILGLENCRTCQHATLQCPDGRFLNTTLEHCAVIPKTHPSPCVHLHCPKYSKVPA